MNKYLKNLRQIIEGYTNYITNENEDLMFSRSKICAGCPLYDNGFCSKNKEVDGVRGCGCFLQSKSRVKDSKCPRDLWPKID